MVKVNCIGRKFGDELIVMWYRWIAKFKSIIIMVYYSMHTQSSLMQNYICQITTFVTTIPDNGIIIGVCLAIGIDYAVLDTHCSTDKIVACDVYYYYFCAEYTTFQHSSLHILYIYIYIGCGINHHTRELWYGQR